MEDYKLNWISKMIAYKLSIDLEYERDNNENNIDEELFNIHQVNEDDLVYIYNTLHKMVDKIDEDGALSDYLLSCDRDTAWELYLSTSGHGAGFFDHSTEGGDRIQAILDSHYKHVCEDWSFYCNNNKLCFAR